MHNSTHEVREDDKLVGDYKTMKHLLVEVEGDVTWHIATVYRPPPLSKNGLTNSQFLEDMEAMLNELLMLPGRLLIVSDFNLHFDDLNDKHVQSFRDLLEAVGMTQHVTQPSHRDGHILDFVISHQCDASLQDVEVLPRCVSDHHAVTCQLQMARSVLASSTMPCWKMKNINPTSFARDLGIQLVACDVGSGVAAAAQHYYDSIVSILEKYAPVKLCTIRGNTAKPRYSDVINGVPQLRRQCEHKWLKTHLAMRSTESCVWDNRMQVVQLAHQQCKAGLFLNHYHLGNAEWYRVINDLLTSATTRSLPSHDNEQELANCFVQFFHCKVTALSTPLWMTYGCNCCLCWRSHSLLRCPLLAASPLWHLPICTSWSRALQVCCSCWPQHQPACWRNQQCWIVSYCTCCVSSKSVWGRQWCLPASRWLWSPRSWETQSVHQHSQELPPCFEATISGQGDWEGGCRSAVLSPVSSWYPWPDAVSIQTCAQHGDGTAEDPGQHQQRSGLWGWQSACSLGSHSGLRHHRPHHPAGASGGCGWHLRGCTGLAEVLSPWQDAECDHQLVRSTTVDLSIGVLQGIGPGPPTTLLGDMSYLCVLSLGATLEFIITAMSMTASCTPSSTYKAWTATGMCCNGWRCVWRMSGSACSPTSSR